MERAAVRRQIHHGAPAGEDLQRVEDGARHDRLGEHPQNRWGVPSSRMTRRASHAGIANRSNGGMMKPVSRCCSM